MGTGAYKVERLLSRLAAASPSVFSSAGLCGKGKKKLAKEVKLPFFSINFLLVCYISVGPRKPKEIKCISLH